LGPLQVIKPLQVLQNRAIRIITGTPQHVHASLSPVYKHLKILKLEDIVKVQIATLMHQFHTSKIPWTYCNLIEIKSTHNYRTRHAQESNFKKTYACTELGKKSFSFKRPKIWNEVPANLKDQSFNSKLKNHLFESYK